MNIHGAPQGVTDYLDPSSWPWLTGQLHWKVSGPTPIPDSPLVPGISHTHIECHAPIWAELGAGPVTIPIALRLFQCKGKLPLVWAEMMGPNGPVAFSEVVIDTPLPLVGDANGLVSVTGHATFDPSLGTDTIPLHGWFNTRVCARTLFDDGHVADCELWVPYFSVLDVSKPEPNYGEGTMEFAAKCTIEGDSVENGGMGIHLTEVRGTESQARGYLPILAPFNTPETVYVLTYNYKALPTLRGNYDLRLDANFHMGVEGTVLGSTQTQIPGVSGVSNVDTLDPVVIAHSQPQMGTTPGKHRVVALWEQNTDAGSPGFKPNARLVSLLGFEVAIGDHPIPVDPPNGVTIPNVVGLTQHAASVALTAAGLMVGSIASVNSETVPTGTVIRQSPTVGITVPAMTMVSLQVSLGPVPVDPPPAEWQVITPIVKRLAVPGQLSRFCLCVEGTTECVELLVGPDPEAD